ATPGPGVSFERRLRAARAGRKADGVALPVHRDRPETAHLPGKLAGRGAVPDPHTRRVRPLGKRAVRFAGRSACGRGRAGHYPFGLAGAQRVPGPALRGRVGRGDLGGAGGGGFARGPRGFL
ncbi:MAG: hypothetical protein AVDCRST_MAG02-4204, partial [uncultured Rubrobacteraceae bacterium]